MKLLNASTFFAQLRQQRYAWLDGHLGAGKTSFVVALGEHMAMRYGYRFTSNIPVVFQEPHEKLSLMSDGMAHIFMMLDEGGMFLPSSAVAKMFRGFLAKLDVYVVLASNLEPPPILRDFVIEPVISFLKVGVPWIVYKWELRTSRRKEKDFFIWRDASVSWGWYSRQYPAMGPNGCDRLIERLVKELAAYHGQTTENLEGLFTLTEADAAALMADAAAQMERAAERIESVGAEQAHQKKRAAWRRRR
jgi:hypothetical protein